MQRMDVRRLAGASVSRARAQRRWLELYAEQFDTVEVNSTFYRLARREAVAGWVAQTPPGFLFAVKASRYLTHVKRLVGIEEGIKRFYEPLEPLISAGRLGPVLWQLPENFHRDDERLHGWLALLPEGLHTIEFRHASWFVPEVIDALRAHGVALTIGDHPARPFQTHAATRRLALRPLPPRLPRAERQLLGARRSQSGPSGSTRWRRRHAVYAYFNNDGSGFAPANARALLRRLGSA